MSAPAAGLRARPGDAALLGAQLRYATADLWRTRVVLIFTFALPVVWLLVVGAIAGNATLDESTGLRVMQFATPSAISMGVLYAAYPTVAISLAEARERGVLKRLRGTPLPAWIYLAGRIGAAVVFALASVAASLAVGVLGFGVQIIWRTAAATAVTLVLGIACFAAIGLAVAAVAPSQTFAQAASVGTAVGLTFVSGLFTFGGSVPGWLETLGDVLPLKPFTELLQDQFNPYLPGSGWNWAHLAVVAAWGVAGALVAARFFRWDPGARARRGERARVASGAVETAAVRGAAPAAETRPTSARTRVLGQARAANRSAWRDGGSLFFALIMPVALYAFITSTQGKAVAEVHGVPFPVFYAASMVAWGTGVAAFLNLPEAVALARDRGVLKRLRGTPLRPWEYLAGRTAAGLWLAVVIAAVVLAVGVAFYDVRLSAAGLLIGLLVLVVGTGTWIACGFAMAAVVPNSRAVGAVGLLILLPLAFFSDVFVVGGPDWMTSVGAFFPLLHYQHALVQAWDPAGAALAWGDLGVLLAWLVGATILAVRFFRWEVRRGG